MNDVPLVQKNDINSINTSLIAIKKQLKQLTEAVGLIDVPDLPDLSPYVKKSDVVDVVESGNMNPVTSNAVVPVDEVAVGNMHSVTSNAVAKSLSYSTQEVKTGGTWIDGKPIYRKCFVCTNSSSIGAVGWLNARNAFTGTETVAQSISSLIDVDIMLNSVYPFIICGALGTNPADIALYNPLNEVLPLTAGSTILIIEYTKTTD